MNSQQHHETDFERQANEARANAERICAGTLAELRNDNPRLGSLKASILAAWDADGTSARYASSEALLSDLQDAAYGAEIASANFTPRPDPRLRDPWSGARLTLEDLADDDRRALANLAQALGSLMVPIDFNDPQAQAIADDAREQLDRLIMAIFHYQQDHHRNTHNNQEHKNG